MDQILSWLYAGEAVRPGFQLLRPARYYLTNSKVQGALRLLLDNLNTAGIPMALISQYMPVQYARVHVGILPPKAEDLLMDRVGDCIDDYLYAVLRD